MKLSPLPLSLLLLLPLHTTAEVQAPLQRPSGVHATRRTLVDALSADPDNYSHLLRLLQRARLIPTLNRLNGSVLFAPTNDAIERHASKCHIWGNVFQVIAQESYDMLDESELETRDNVNEELRQELLYHLVNYTVALPDSGKVDVLETLHYPRKQIDPPTKEPPPGPPWIPIPGGTLGGESQRLRVSGDDKGQKVGVDYRGKGGSKVVKSEDGGNGLLVAVDEVLSVPQDLATIITNHPKLTYLTQLIPPKMLETIQNSSALTLFLPTDSSWDSLPEIEKTYLESEFAEDDLIDIFSMHVVHKSEVKWADRLLSANGSKFETLFGSKLNISVEDDEFRIGSAKVVEPDIYASNGVLHIVDNLLIPDDAIKLTHEKYLLALNCTKFISLVHSVNATYLINGTDLDEPRTILAMSDDVLSQSPSDDLPEQGSDELKRLLEYHFLPERWTNKNLKDGMLLPTELKELGLNGSRQVLPVEVDLSKKLKDSPLNGLRFGGARTVQRVDIKNTVVYFISRPITPPTDALSTALPSLHLSTFIAAVFSTALDEKLKKSPSTTILIPQNTAFENLGGLVSTHLLSSSSTAKKDLEAVILHHVIQGINYLRDLSLGSLTSFETLEGSDLHMDQVKGESILVSASGGWPGMKANLDSRGDILTQTGVMHELGGVLIPRSVELTNSKLVKAAQGSTMSNLITRAGLGWILNGTLPPPDSEWADKDVESVGWTLLVPNDDAFKGRNITRLWEEEEKLKAFVYQHIIPTPRTGLIGKGVISSAISHQPLPLNKTTTYATLQSDSSLNGDLTFIPGPEGEILVRIKDIPESKGKNASAKVLSWGRCTAYGGTGGVIQIDRLLEPWQPSFWGKYGPPTAGGVVGVVLIAFFFYIVRLIWRRDTMEPTYEPVGGFDPEEEQLSNGHGL